MDDRDLCAYCGVTPVTGDERPEHPIPAALGSSWTVATVCNACNAWANTHVDQPFLNDGWVRIHRSKHDIRDRRRKTSKPPPHPLRSGETGDGRRATLSPNGELTVHPRVVHDGDASTIHASSMEEAERILDQIRERAARDGMAIEIQNTHRERGPLNVRTTVRSDLKAWMRMGAKIALAAGSVAYDHEWRTGPDATYLRRLFHDGQDQDRFLIPEQVDDDHVFRNLADPPEHVIWFQGEEPTKLIVVLFGELFFAIPVHAAPRPAPSIAWRLDPRRPRAAGQTTDIGIYERVLERNPAPDWRDE